MQAQQNAPSPDLPTIPDYPDSPLPAWQHYGITNYAGQKIQEELDRIGYSGYLIGLGVAYRPENGKTYSMQFGRVDDADELEEDQPLSDDFLLHLYQITSQFIAHNTSLDGTIDTELRISIKGSQISIRVMCRIIQAGECTHQPGHDGSRMVCRSYNGGNTWHCLGSHC